MPLGHFSKTTKSVHHHLINDKEIVAEHAALSLTQSLRSFAVSLVGIFLPIYIYINSADYLIFHQDKVLNGIIWGFAYFFLRSFGAVIFSAILTKPIFSKIHMNRSIVISIFVQILEIYLWIQAASNMYLMLLAGLLAGLKVATYWIPYHTYFVKKFKGGKYGKNTGIRFLFEKSLAGLSPLIGGFVISRYGFDAAFVISMVLLIVSGIPILLAIHENKHKEHDVENILKNFLFNKKYKKMTIAYLGEAMDAAIFSIGWPILLYIGLASFVKIGTLTSVTTIISAITGLLVGRAMDKYGSKLVHGVGVFFNTILYIPRVFATTALGLYAIDIADRLNSPMYSLPNQALAYEKAKRSESSTDYMIYREFTIHIWISLISVSLIVVLTQVLVWRWIFLFAALGSSLTYLMDLDTN